MKFNDNDIEILKNFATIQPNVLFTKGNEIKTISTDFVIFAKAKFNADIEQEFGIYDLNEFLNTMSLVDDPDINLEDNFAKINDQSGRSKIKYYYSDKDLLEKPKKDTIVLPSIDVEFSFDNETMMKIKKASAVLGYNILSVKSTNNEGILNLEVNDPDDATSNTFSLDVPGEFSSNAEFDFMFNINNFKFMPYTYNVSLCEKGVSHFVNDRIEYFVALEKDSKYNIKES